MGGETVTPREYAARELERMARNIRRSVYPFWGTGSVAKKLRKRARELRKGERK